MRGPISVTVRRKGPDTKRWLKKNRRLSFEKLAAYGERGVMALASATPIDTGLTAMSWNYEIKFGENTVSLIWTNSNAPRHVPVALLIQYGHATKGGKWVEGIDYINPALKPIFDEIANDVWKEVTFG